MDNVVEEFNASISKDQILYKHDIKGSIVHVTMLETKGLVSKEERNTIIQGLE